MSYWSYPNTITGPVVRLLLLILVVQLANLGVMLAVVLR